MLRSITHSALDKVGDRNILPSVNSLSYILMAFQQYKLFVHMKTEKTVNFKW
jgi:hypothetical protein